MSSFRDCTEPKSHISAKEALLKPLIVNVKGKGELFFCPQCKHLCLLVHARLDHQIPLKELWLSYEKYEHSSSLSWATFHQRNAKLRIRCKDCEKKL